MKYKIPSLEDIPADSKYVHPYLPFYTIKTLAGKFSILHQRSFLDWTVDDLDKTFEQILKDSPDALLIDLKDSAGAGGGTSDFELHNTKTILSIPMRDSRIEKDDKGIEENSVIPDKISDDELIDFLSRLIKSK